MLLLLMQSGAFCATISAPVLPLCCATGYGKQAAAPTAYSKRLPRSGHSSQPRKQAPDSSQNSGTYVHVSLHSSVHDVAVVRAWSPGLSHRQGARESPSELVNGS
jgi:hypothetical protein